MPKTTHPEQMELSNAHQSRRKFLRYAGSAALITTGLTACNKIIDFIPKGPAGSGSTVDLGSGDVGILNYAYALEQLEAAFYIRVLDLPFQDMTAIEKSRLGDIRDHEIAHREFFKTALGNKAIKELDFNFTTVNFLSRNSVLGTAKAFEDLGVSAYNGAGHLIASADYLTLAGKIVSVEARHAAFIRDLIKYGSFADSTVIDNNGLEMHKMPSEVLPIAGQFIVNKIDGSHLPS